MKHIPPSSSPSPTTGTQRNGIRITGNTEKDGHIQVCDHIRLEGAYFTELEGCEYVETVHLHCTCCEKDFELDVMIN